MSRQIGRREPSSAPIEHECFDWFPLAVWSGREKLARIMLEDAGLTTFHLVRVEWRNANKYDRARRAKRRTGYPLVPGLVFVGLRRGQRYPWHLVVAPHVVSHVISDRPDRPRRLSHDAIGRLLEARDSGRFVRPDHQRYMPTGGEFGEGDQVRMWRGAFEGKRLKVEKIDDRMLAAFVTFFGERRLIWLPLEDAEIDPDASNRSNTSNGDVGS